MLLALPAALTDFILLAVLNVAGNCAGIGHEQLSTMCIMILLAVGMAALIRICMPLDKTQNRHLYTDGIGVGIQCAVFKTAVCIVSAVTGMG